MILGGRRMEKNRIASYQTVDYTYAVTGCTPRTLSLICSHLSSCEIGSYREVRWIRLRI